MAGERTPQKAASMRPKKAAVSSSPSPPAAGGSASSHVPRPPLPSGAHVLYLTKYNEEPEDYLKEMLSYGYFRLEISTDGPVDWPRARYGPFVDFIPGTVTSATGANRVEGALLAVASAPLPDSMFLRLLYSLFAVKWSTPLLGFPEGTGETSLPPVKFSVLRFSKTLALNGSFVDTHVDADDSSIDGYRVIFFDRPVSVLVDLFHGAHSTGEPSSSSSAAPVDKSFFNQRKAFWDDFHFLDAHLGLYGKGSYLSTSGSSSIIDVGADQILILPAPSSFRPLSSKDDYYMATAFFPSFESNPIDEGGPNLALALSTAAVTTKFPGNKTSVFDRLGETDKAVVEACGKATLAQDPATYRVFTAPQDVTAVKHPIWPPSKELLKLLEAGARAFRPAAEDPIDICAIARKRTDVRSDEQILAAAHGKVGNVSAVVGDESPSDSSADDTEGESANSQEVVDASLAESTSQLNLRVEPTAQTKSPKRKANAPPTGAPGSGRKKRKEN